MEQLTLTTPTPAYRVAKLYLDWDGAVIRIWLRGTDGLEERWHVYDGDTATALMVALNTANLSVTSLQLFNAPWVLLRVTWTNVNSGTSDTCTAAPCGWLQDKSVQISGTTVTSVAITGKIGRASCRERV